MVGDKNKLERNSNDTKELQSKGSFRWQRNGDSLRDTDTHCLIVVV